MSGKTQATSHPLCLSAQAPFLVEVFNQHMARTMCWNYAGHHTKKQQQIERPRTWRELRKTRKQFALVGNYL